MASARARISLKNRVRRSAKAKPADVRVVIRGDPTNKCRATLRSAALYDNRREAARNIRGCPLPTN
jgi:hypothetical protein